MAVTKPQVQAAFDATDGVVPPPAARAILVEKLTPLFNGGDPSVILGPDLSAIQDLTGFGVPRRVADGVWSILPVDAAGGVPLLDASGLIKRSQLSEVTLSGVVGSSLPELIRDGVAGTVTMPSVVVQGFNNAHYQGIPMRYTTAETTLSVPEGAQYFVACVIANDSTSSVQLVLKPQLSLSNCIPLYSVSRIGTQIHAIGFDTMGCGLPQKQETALLETQPYRRSLSGGLMISEDATRHVLLTPARAYAGTTPVELLAFDSNTDRLVECYHAGGAWAYSAVAQYDNSSIDNGTNKVAMGLNKWKAVWFFRSVGDDKEVFYVLGTEEYNTEAAAQVAQRPAIPDAIAWHVIFVGRSIIQNGAAVGDMQSAFVDAFSVAQISDHNLLSGLQGGAAGDYQHLTAAQVSAFAAKESSLGNPSVSGRILSSTTAGVRSWVAPYALPTASASVLGGVKVGTGLSIASGVLSVAYGSSAGTACQGNDSRLSDARTPTAHTHPASDISGLTGWATKAFTNGSTSDVSEGSNLYFTPGRVLPVNLTGFAVGINESINSSMTILAAFGAAQGQINARLTTVTADTASRAANTVYAAPNGSAGTATFRSLVPADIPNLDAAKLASGTLGYARGGTGISAPGATAGNLRWSGSAFAIDTAAYALASAIPAASTTTPSALGTAAVGTGTTWARADHVHAMPTAAQVGAVSSSSGVVGLTLPSSTSFASSFTQDIFGTTARGYFLRQVRTEATAPSSLLGNYASGLAWKGEDTYGSLMVAYHSSIIRVSGGNGSDPVWTVDLWHTGKFTQTDVSHWDTAYGWGNHAAAGYMVAASYPDLVAIEALAGTSGLLRKTAANTWSLDTASYLTTAGTAAAATKLATGRTIGITGDATWTSPTFDGTANVAAALILASVIAAGGPVGSGATVPVITYDAKGRLTAVTTAAITPAGIGAAASVHGHAIVDVTGLQTALDGKQASLGYTPVNKAGDTMTGALKVATSATIDSTGGNARLVMQKAGVQVFEKGLFAVDNSVREAVYDDTGAWIDDAISYLRPAGGTITIGGSTATKRDVNLTKDLKLSGVVAITAGRAGSLTTLVTTGLTTVQSLNISGLTGSRMLSLDASKNVQALDAAGSRALIGAAASSDLPVRIHYMVTSTPGPSEWTLGTFNITRSFLEVFGYANGDASSELRIYSGAQLAYSVAISPSQMFHVRIELFTGGGGFVFFNNGAPAYFSCDSSINPLSVRTFGATDYIVFRKIIY